MASADLERVASRLVADGKGILAADETVPTLTRRFETLGIKSTEQSRRTYHFLASRGINPEGSPYDPPQLETVWLGNRKNDMVNQGH